MATVEFFKIKIEDKKTNKELIDFDFLKLLQNKLSDTSDAMRHCTHGVRSKCSASIGTYIPSENNITFDLIKFQQEYIKSTLISEPKSEVDTYDVLHKISVKNAIYSEREYIRIKNIIENSLLNLFEVKEELKRNFNKINKFSIYKIILEKNLDRQEENNSLSELFFDEFLKRLSVDKTFFNIFSSKYEKNILLMERNNTGFTFTHLENYFNDHLLKDETYKILIERKYDKKFISILQHEKLHKFEFSLRLQAPTFNGQKITEEFEELFLKYFKNTKLTITVNPLDKEKSLDNKEMINFFMSAREEGLLSSVRISKSNDKQKNIESTSEGEMLKYTTKTKKTNNLKDAHNLFQSAIQKNLKE